jgi:ketosteroid isomerase-like protein
MSETEAIRSVIEARIRAIAAKDAEGAVAMLDPQIVAFEVAGPPQIPAEQARDVAATQAWLDSFDGAPGVELQELTIHVDGDVGFCHSLNRLTGRMADGRNIDLVMRSTLGLRKRDGAWTIVHAHTSVPR